MNAQDTYYYYKGQKINLITDKNYLNVINSNNVREDSKSEISNTLLQKFDLEFDNNMQYQDIKKLKFKSAPSKLEYSNTIEKLKHNSNRKYICPYFERGGSVPIGTSNIFYVKLKNAADTLLLKNIANEKEVEIVKQVPFMSEWYVLSLGNSTFNHSVEASNYFYETGNFDDVDPAFMFNFSPNCTNDPSFSNLWGLYNSSNPDFDINICDAWEYSQGANVIVAVVDDGIQRDHYELQFQMHPLSFDSQAGTSPSAFDATRSHGTHVAGIIAAEKDNHLQGVGVAPGSKIMGISYNFTSSSLSADMASGISWAWQHGAHIITNSWGESSDADPSVFRTPILEDAIIDALTQGRAGKGCVVLFATGNLYSDNIIDYPANFHKDIIAVGAINSDGHRANYSHGGNELDIVAPGTNILSTVPMNNSALKTGTSMATPHVAGVAALLLSRNPNLTREHVSNIIELTAQKVHPYNSATNPSGYIYATTPGRPNGTWNNLMGYGLVDALAAVEMANCAFVQFTNQTVSSNRTPYSCHNLEVQNVTVTNNAKLTLNAPNRVIINGPFKINSGSQLKIN
ncbi:hypothetical protein FACS189474_5320 [Bacteroidia bacterium]|nr:hypothetical protein FACS189474_5320 [Bacteroidia bacterium]